MTWWLWLLVGLTALLVYHFARLELESRYAAREAEHNYGWWWTS